MADEDLFLINSGGQLVLPPPKRERVALTGFPKVAGRTPGCMVHELTMPEHDEYLESNRDAKDGSAIVKGQNRRFLWYVMRDPNANHLWPSPEDAVRALAPLGFRALDNVFKVANRLNYGTGQDDTEGNSGGALTGSSDGPSASAPESPPTHES